jgi:hypothetical protein
MPSTPTPILSLTVPTVGGDANTWGTELNADLAILDNLGAAAVIPVNTTPYNATIGTFPETVFRCTTGASNMVFNLPAASLCSGKIFTVKKLDIGLGIVRVIGSIDGQTEYDLTNQYQYVRVYSNGVTFDVIGGN